MKTPQQHRTFARALAAGAGVKYALVQAGYSSAQASKGWAIVRKSSGLRDAMADEGRWLCELGSSITARDQENLVRGRLIKNTIEGCDRGVASARALGNDKRVAMFTPEAQMGIIVVEAPKDLSVPVAEHFSEFPVSEE